MSRVHLGWHQDLVAAGLAAATVWVSFFAWRGLVEEPASYLLPLALGVTLVAVTGTVLRSLRVPVLAVPLGQILVGVLWLNRVWAPELSVAGLIPTPASLAELVNRFRLGVEVAQQYSAPVPPEAPAIFAVLIVSGLLTAIMVDLLACGLRRAPLAGLPLLMVYTVPSGIVDEGVPWWAFALGAFGFLLMIAQQEVHRIRHWGQSLPLPQASAISDLGQATGGSLGAATRRIGLVTTGMALVLPTIIPVFEDGLPGGFGPGGGSGGGDSVSIANPMLDLRRDLSRGQDVDLVRVTTLNPDPSYLRISVLDEFDGEAWKPSDRNIPADQRAEGDIPLPDGLDEEYPGDEYSYDVESSSVFRSRWLPTYYPPTFVRAEGDWRYDLATFDFASAVEEQDTFGLDYEMRALDLAIDADRLEEAVAPRGVISDPGTRLPDDLPEEVADLAEQVTEGADTDFAQAVTLQRWFRTDGGFRYSLDQDPGNGNEALLEFLADEPGGRVGYCEQFAAAMAVMARSLGIPARVAVGFLQPDATGTNEFTFSAHDMHAWPELYFEGSGWVRFEPTPQFRAAGIPSYTRGDVTVAEPEQPSASGAPSQEPSASSAAPRPDQLEEDLAAGAGSDGPTVWPWLLGLVLLGGLALVPRLARTAVRRRRWALAHDDRGLAEAAWAELRATAIDAGLPWNDRVSPRANARSLRRRIVTTDGDPRDIRHPGGLAGAQASAAALDRVVLHVERGRFSRTPLAAEQVRADTESAVEGLLCGVTPRAQRRALWWPRSVLGAARPVRETSLEETATATGRVVDHAI